MIWVESEVFTRPDGLTYADSCKEYYVLPPNFQDIFPW